MTVKPSPPPGKLKELGREVNLWLLGLANRRARAQPDSVAATLADLRADHNALLAKFRAAGLMEE